MAVDGLRLALSERYTIERELGRGGMATVYLATDVKVGRRVAIKVLLPELAAALGGERFHREIRIATQLSHPNILPVYDSGEAEGTLYYVMPYVDGESLRTRLDRERQLPIEDAIRITCQIAMSLDYAHAQGIIHRDIKPENILLEAGQAVLADFGIARAVTSSADAEALTRTGMSLGTPAYMSPEQAMGERNLDGRADQYALACVTYEVLAGQPPFTAPTMQGVVARHIAEQPPLITTVRPSVPDEVQDVILQALEKVPADRFTTIAEFARALADAGAMTMTATSRRVTAASRAMRYTTRTNRATARPQGPMSRPRQAVFAALALVLLAGSAVAAVWAWDRPVRSVSPGALGLEPRKIAVLYLDDLSRDKKLGPLASGLTESLIDRLNQVRTLDVISANGVRPFRGTDVEVDSVAERLGTGTVVRGSVEEESGRVRVQVRLVDGNSGAEIKRASFSRPAGDVLTLRDQLGEQVAQFLRERLGEEVRLREQRESTRNVDAWLLLRRAEKTVADAEAAARADSADVAASRFQLADSLLARAERLDRHWVDPVVARGRLAYRRFRTDPRPQMASLIDSARMHAQRALTLSEKSPTALELRGMVRYRTVIHQLEQNPAAVARLLKDAEQDLRAAVTADPSLATAWFTLSDLHVHNGAFTEAKLAARRAYEEDAFLSAAPQILWLLFGTSYEYEDFVDADNWCQEGQRRFPEHASFVRCQLFLLTTDVRRIEVEEAWKLAGRFRRMQPARSRELDGRIAQAFVAIRLARAGLADSALRVIERTRTGGAIDPDRQLFQYEAYVRLLRGERAEALKLLEQFLAVNPEVRKGMARRTSWWWRDLANDPRFKAMVQTGG